MENEDRNERIKRLAYELLPVLIARQNERIYVHLTTDDAFDFAKAFVERCERLDKYSV